MASAIQTHLLRQDSRSTLADNENSDTMNRIDYDAWLLPPVALGTADRLIKRLSVASGPIALCAFAGMAVRLFV